MNRNQYAIFSALLLLLTLVLEACRKTPLDASSGFSATINGTSFGTIGYNALYTPRTNQIDVTGSAIHDEDTTYLYLIFPDSSFKKPIDIKTIANITYYDAGKNFMYDSYADFSHGTLTVNSLNLNSRMVSGTFSGVIYAYSGFDSVVLTNGKFSSPFVVQ